MSTSPIRRIGRPISSEANAADPMSTTATITPIAMRMRPARDTAAVAWLVAASLAALAVAMAWPRSFWDPISAGLARSF